MKDNETKYGSLLATVIVVGAGIIFLIILFMYFFPEGFLPILLILFSILYIFTIGYINKRRREENIRKEKVLQQKKESSLPSAHISAADELLKYKKLLDLGAITEDEFIELKKQLINK